jgi:hypothetical protein
LSNRGLKFEYPTVFRLKNILSLESIVIDVGMPRSHVFAKQLKLRQIQKLELT